MTYAKRERPEAVFTTSEKLMQTFRMPRDLVTFLKGEAQRRGVDLTAYVTRVLDGLRSQYGLPAPAARMLDEDREALARALAGVAHLPGFLAGIHQRLDRIERRVDELRRAFPPVLVTLHEAARALGVSYATVRRMKKAGRLPLVGAGRSARVDLTGLRPLSDEDAERVARHLASEPEGPLREKDDAT